MDRDPKGYYASLFVATDASDEEIKRKYRRLARKFHPDANPGDQEAAEEFRKIQEAYEVLRDPAKRTAYDRSAQGTSPQAGPSQPQGPPQEPAWNQSWPSSTPPPPPPWQTTPAPSAQPKAPASQAEPHEYLRWWEAVALTVLQAAGMLAIGFALSVLASPWAKGSLGDNSNYHEGIRFLLKVTVITVIPPVAALCAFNTLACHKLITNLGDTMEEAWRASLAIAVPAGIVTVVATAIDTSITGSAAAPIWTWWVVPNCMSIVFVGVLVRSTTKDYIVICGSAVAGLALGALLVHAEPNLMVKMSLITIGLGVVSGIACYALDLTGR